MTLYEMTTTASYLYSLLDDGEIDEQTVADSLDGLGVGDKLEDYCKVIRQFEADKEAYSAEKARFDAKAKQADRAIERLKAAIVNYMATTGKKEQRCGLFEIKTSQSKAVAILDEEKIDPMFLVPQPAKINKTEIRKALMEGIEVPGATLQINTNIKIK